MEELSPNWFLEQIKLFNIDNVENNSPDNEPKKKRVNSKSTMNGNAKRKRPRESLAVLIYQAMQYYRRKLTVAEISDFISEKYVYYRVRKHWTITGTIRNALSKDSRFHKTGRSQQENKRGCFWKLSCESLWDQIVCGNAPLITSENEFRLELKKLNIIYQGETTASESSQSSDPFYSSPLNVEDSNWMDSDNFDCIEFDEFEMFVNEIDNKHPWQDDKQDSALNEWNEWIY